MKTCLVAAADARRWQPIETAPKDEPVILAVRHRITRKWLLGEGQWQTAYDDSGDWWWANEFPGDYGYGVKSISATHGPPKFWQPLPPPPEDLSEGAGT